MRSLSSKMKDLPAAVLSAVVVESAAQFRDNSVVQLLDSQSAMSYLLLHSTYFDHLFDLFILFTILTYFLFP